MATLSSGLFTLAAIGQSAEPKPTNADAFHDKADDFFKLGLIFRASGQYDKALEAYQWMLRVHPQHPLASKVKQEIRALQRIQAGHRRLLGDPFELEMTPIRRGFPSLSIETYQEMIDGVAERYPDHWEPMAFSAQNHMRMNQLEAAKELIAKAEHAGGEPAKTAVSELKRDLDHRLHLAEIKTTAENYIAQKKHLDAAKHLESAWTKDPTLVEFGLQAAKLYAESNSHKDASRICLSIADRLKEHPDHPMATIAGRVRALGEQSAKADELQKKLTPKKKTTSRSSSPPRKKPSPLDLYKQRTR